MRELGIAIVAVSCAFTLALAGCAAGGQGALVSSSPASSGSISSSEPAQAGGWSVPEGEISATLDADQLSVYQEAAKTMDTAVQPVALLGTQLVSGMNYAFLGLGEQGAEAAGWNVVVCYRDLQGKVIPTCMNAIDLSALALVEPSGGDSADAMVGAWEIPVPEKPVELPADAQAAYDAAMTGYVGMALTPIALLGTQVVSGTNYLLLCAGMPVVQAAKASLYVVEVHEDLNGKAEVASVDELDFLSYIGN